MFRSALVVAALLFGALAGLVVAHRCEDPRVLGRWSEAWTAVVVLSLGAAALAMAANLRPIYPRLYARRRRLLLGVVASAAALGASELLVRLFDPLGISYYEASTRYTLDKVADPDLVFFHRPHLNASYAGVEVRSNELGMRDAPIQPKQPGELRVLALGDSVTFGWGVAADSIWCTLLAPRLAATLERPVRTLNAGCGGFNTVQELAFLRKHGAELAPDVVVLLYVENDVEQNLPPFDPVRHRSLRGKSLPEAVKLLLGRSWTWRLAWHLAQTAGAPAFAAGLAREPGALASFDALEQIDAWCKARGIPFVTFLWRIVRDPQSDALRSELERIARARGFPFCDVLPWFAACAPSAVTCSVIDSHPNAAGHAILAEGIARALEEQVLRR